MRYFHYRGVMLRDYSSVVCALFTASLLVFLLQRTDCCAEQQTLLALFRAAILKAIALVAERHGQR